LRVLVRLLGLAVLPSARGGFGFTFLFILLLALTAVGGYLHLGVGWASNSGYGIIGALRCLAQRVSYEVSLALLFLCVALRPGFMDLARIGAGAGAPAGTLAPPLLVLWWVSCLAETNRRPFDFAEGESELVSGFNVEYGSGPFALLFIAEYTRIVLIALLTVLLF
jgi:NADH:ubiquinone oxidoreductase subunit H